MTILIEVNEQSVLDSKSSHILQRIAEIDKASSELIILKNGHRYEKNDIYYSTLRPIRERLEQEICKRLGIDKVEDFPYSGEQTIEITPMLTRLTGVDNIKRWSWIKEDEVVTHKTLYDVIEEIENNELLAKDNELNKKLKESVITLSEYGYTQDDIVHSLDLTLEEVKGMLAS